MSPGITSLNAIAQTLPQALTIHSTYRRSSRQRRVKPWLTANHFASK